MYTTFSTLYVTPLLSLSVLDVTEWQFHENIRQRRSLVKQTDWNRNMVLSQCPQWVFILFLKQRVCLGTALLELNPLNLFFYPIKNIQAQHEYILFSLLSFRFLSFPSFLIIFARGGDVLVNILGLVIDFFVYWITQKITDRFWGNFEQRQKMRLGTIGSILVVIWIIVWFWEC